MWAAAWGERKAETGINANWGTNPRTPGKAGATSAGSDSKVHPHCFLFYLSFPSFLIRELWKKVYLLNLNLSSPSLTKINILYRRKHASSLTVVSFSSLVVDKQPPQVIKTQSKFSTTVRYLLGEKVAPGKPVVLKAQIINELQARNLGSVPGWVIV